MRNKETGEFELVVGDRQLLSGFFLGVLLLAVVFALGYVLGQSSPRSTKLATEAAVTSPDAANRPQPASPAIPRNDTPATAAPADTAPAQTTAAADRQPEPTTLPARDPSAPVAPPPPLAKPVAAPAETEPANASYLQVTASASRTSAELVLKSLKESGFPAILRAGPNNLTAVWVGPYTERKQLAEAKGKLEKAGFNNPIVRKP